jgi:dipeptidyl aminopeptidase/acylaminoacyl peptidase
VSSRSWRAFLVYGAFVLGASGVGGAAFGAALPPVADFFKPPDFSELVMSPSGRRVCALVGGPDGRKRLAILDLADLTKSKVIAGFKDTDVVDAEWVNDDRVVFSVYDKQDSLIRRRHAALLAVDALGKEPPRLLIRQSYDTFTSSTNIVDRSLTPNHRLRAVLGDGSNDVILEEYVFSNIGEVQSVNLKRLDTTTGFVRGLSQGAPPGALSWALDSTGSPRVVETRQGGKQAMYWKATPTADWVKMRETDTYSDGAPPDPIFVDAGNRLYVSARAGAKEDTTSLMAVGMDEELGKARALLTATGYDISPGIVSNGRGVVLGVRYLTDARATFWFDPGLKKYQEQVDALLPGTVNRLDCGNCDNRDKLLVAATSDRQPTTYWLFDTKTGKLMAIASSRGWIKPSEMAQRDMLRFEARDGLSVPVHVTRPAGTKTPLPMVVLVHGGPFMRGGEWTWDPESQFLASRGYVVVEPEFRGSLGFGRSHFIAGWKQWGLAMQDDVADAAQWAIKQGYADPKRVCIAGASYGGYATLMGLIRNPEIFRCGFEWVGVTDINLMYTINWSDLDTGWQQYGMPKLIGDPVKDADQLAATSPIKLADKVKQPLLMAYGGLDRRVPIEHGTQFRDAVRKGNKDVEWIEYADEAHGWWQLSVNVDFWTRVERFLDKNLKNAP